MSAASEFTLNGARVLITGASRGIGAALATELARSGARVVILSRHVADAETLRNKLNDPSAHLALAGDVADVASLDTAFATIRRQFGSLDAVVANAAILAAGPFESVTPEAMRRVLDTNVLGVMRTIQLALPLLERSDRKPRRIVVLGSFAGRRGVPGLALYSASKGAIVALCDALRAELEADVERAITVSQVAPGPTRTSFFVSPFAKERSFEPNPVFEPSQSATLVVRALRHGDAHIEATKFFRLKQLLAALTPRRDDARIRRRLNSGG